MTSTPFPLTPLEVASGLVIGVDARREAAGPPDCGGLDPVGALEAELRSALARPPCVVSFSGGRDSSALLALAARVARRDGLDDPIPVTNAFPGVDRADEASWQELVVAHLGLRDWIRNAVDDELDCVGPIAAEALHRHGLLWPFNAHFAVPALRAARGGSLVTGVGGDEALGPSRWDRAAVVLGRRARPRPRDALRVGLALAPLPVRAAVERRRRDVAFPWLRPRAERDVLSAWAREGASEPLRWAPRQAWLGALRYLAAVRASIEVLGDAEDVLTVHPFSEPRFLGALARLPGGRRFDTRTEAMTALFGDLLPVEVLTRASKASFDEAFFNRHSRAFVESWDGGGLAPELVDPDALRATWGEPEPDARSFLALQAAFLASRAGPSGSHLLTGVAIPNSTDIQLSHSTSGEG